MGKKAKLVLEFGTPPPQRRDYRWEEVAAALREKPGVWALVHRDLPASVPAAAKGGRINPVAPRRGFLIRTVGNHRDERNRQQVREMWMVYEPEADLTRAAKRNGGKG